MKYRHVFHAGNFADVHKHVALVALLRALTRKDKGFLLVDTHAGCGRYDLASTDARKGNEARNGLERVLAARGEMAPEIDDYLALVRRLRQSIHAKHACPGSPWLALNLLRPQDRAVFVETQPGEHVTLESNVRATLRAVDLPTSRFVTECADGPARLAHWLPNAERRALVLIDPPYEDTRGDFDAAAKAIANVLQRLPTAIIAVWYPIKHAQDTDAWLDRLPGRVPHDAAHPPQFLRSELWMHPCDTRVGLNGSGLVIVNAPWQTDLRMREWMPQLHAILDPPPAQGGWRVR